jgi:hypothetical protein
MIHDLSTQKGRNAYVKAMSKPKGNIEKKVQPIDKYKVNIEVRDSWGDIIRDDNGNKVTDISYDVEMLTSNMEFNLRHLAKSLKAFMPDRRINIEVYIHNSISRTYMNMFSFYVDEDRFVKH